MNKTCKSCDEQKPLDQFRSHKKRGRMYTQANCKECQRGVDRSQYNKAVDGNIQHREEELKVLRSEWCLKMKREPDKAKWTPEMKEALRQMDEIYDERKVILLGQEPKEFQKGPHRRTLKTP